MNKYLILNVIFFVVFAPQIFAQSLLKDGKIPDDLVIQYSRGSGIGGWKFTIKSDGKVYYEYYSNMPPSPSLIELLIPLETNQSKETKNNRENKPKEKNQSKSSKESKPEETKNNKLQDRVSIKQLEELLSEFERFDFFSVANKLLTKEDGCTNMTITSNTKMISVSIQINGKNYHISEEVGCQPMPESRADKFNGLVKKIEEVLKNVKTNSVETNTHLKKE